MRYWTNEMDSPWTISRCQTNEMHAPWTISKCQTNKMDTPWKHFKIPNEQDGITMKTFKISNERDCEQYWNKSKNVTAISDEQDGDHELRNAYFPDKMEQVHKTLIHWLYLSNNQTLAETLRSIFITPWGCYIPSNWAK